MAYLKVAGRGTLRDIKSRRGSALASLYLVPIAESKLAGVAQKIRALNVAGNENGIVVDILLHHKPRSAAQAQSLTLTQGKKPITLMLTKHPTTLPLHYVALALAKVVTEQSIISGIAKKADALTILAMGRSQAVALSNCTHLTLLHQTDGEVEHTELVGSDLAKEVRLVLDGVRRSCEILHAIQSDRGGIMPRGNAVKEMAYPIIETAKLNQTVAHYVGIGGKPLLHPVDNIGGQQSPP